MKNLIKLLCLLLLLTACGNGTPQVPTATPPATLEPASTASAAASLVQVTATPKFIPKPNDLTFIEFFAVT